MRSLLTRAGGGRKEVALEGKRPALGFLLGQGLTGPSPSGRVQEANFAGASVAELGARRGSWKNAPKEQIPRGC